MMHAEERDRNGTVPLPATSGPRPHRCEICQRSFREIATLRKHELLHRADRPYVCQTCSKSFLWSSNLKVHERVHTGERPYKCKICHRCFTQSNDLRRHERNVHMRGKLYTSKTPAGRPVCQSASTPGQMNLAAYQAFALQQRAMLQHALTYESMMQNSVAMTTSHYLHHARHTQSDKDPTVSTSASDIFDSHDNIDEPRLPLRKSHTLKLEQVSPPPKEFRRLEQSNSNHNDQNKSPKQSGYSPSSSKKHSPSSASLSQYSITNGQAWQLESPNGQRDERPYSCESNHSDTPKYFSSYSDTRSVASLPCSSYSDNRSMTPLPRSSYSDNRSVASLPHSIYSDHRSLTSLPHGFPSAFSMSPTAENGMDLRINKSTSSAGSEDGELDWKTRNASLLSSKSPGSESETDSKRDVTTTSFTPTIDSGIHHCPHCNIFFHDFTMFNLHQSLHSPMDEDPFLCPSCRKHCQDRIEFMFHIVWHVRYPHSIPKYQTFRENQVMSEPEPDHNE